MALTVSLSISPNIVQQNVEQRILVLLTASGTDEIVSGIELWDANGVFKVGDLQRFEPVTFDSYSGGTPVISQIPSWGNGDQSSYTQSQFLGGTFYPSVPLIYPQGNLNPAPTWSETDYPGGWGSTASGVSTFMPITVVSGTTAQYIVSIVSGANNGIQGGSTSTTLLGNIQCRVTSKAPLAAVPEFYQTPGPNAVYAVSKVIKGIQVYPVQAPADVIKGQWSRPPNYSNFDIVMGTSLVYEDDTTEDISLWDITNNYVSGTTGTATIVATGPYGSTAVASMPTSPTAVANSNAVPTWPAGSTPPGGFRSTQLTGGAGALTIVSFPLGGAAPTGTFTSTSISNSITTATGTYTNAVVMRFRNEIPVSAAILPAVAQLTYLPAAVGRQTIDLGLWVQWSSGQFTSETSAAGLGRGWTSSNTNLATVDSNGVVTQIANYPGEVIISAAASYGGGITFIPAQSARIVCTLNPNYAAYATA